MDATVKEAAYLATQREGFEGELLSRALLAMYVYKVSVIGGTHRENISHEYIFG